ncbi:MAG: hypothetical protein IPK66_07505 [Rhodospirillales bacterium]|nr:hypothetical protein [Rhodospirillales bacterium]
MALKWSRFATSGKPVDLSIKNAPDDVIQWLKACAARHHRSLQRELLALIEEAVRTPQMLSAAEVLAKVRRLDLSTPGEAEAIAARLSGASHATPRSLSMVANIAVKKLWRLFEQQDALLGRGCAYRGRLSIENSTEGILRSPKPPIIHA